MDVRFRYIGPPPMAVPPPFVHVPMADGFRIVVPAGYHVDEPVPIVPPAVPVVPAQFPDLLDPIDDIIDFARDNHLLAQHIDFIFRTANVLEVRDVVQNAPLEGLYMYPLGLSRRRDNHPYNNSHQYIRNIQVGDLTLGYRRSVARPNPATTVIARRYIVEDGPEDLPNAGNFLIHYMTGEQHQDENHVAMFGHIP